MVRLQSLPIIVSTIGKVLYAIFFDTTGIVAKVVVPKGRSVTGQYYADTVLPTVLRHCF